jgi:disulfide oxidoreductase YuzD
VLYHNVESEDVRAAHTKLITEIDNLGLLYPVTVVDGTPVYDGAVSYPAIMRAVHNKLLEREAPTNA